MSRNDKAVTAASLEALLETYGADRTRWPAAERRRFAAFIATDAEAQRRLAEAQALDRLLDMAPGMTPGRDRVVVDRVMAAVARETPGSVEPLRFPGARSATGGKAGLGVGRTEWRAAALLAASLILGVFLGTSGLLDRGGAGPADPDVTLVFDESSLLNDEELL